MTMMMTRISIALAMGAAALLVPAAAASAAGFDCSKAASPDELAVCANPQLSALDSEMTGLWFAYSRVPLLMGSSGNRHDEAEAFLARRKACGGDIGCLTKAYQERIAQLQNQISEWMTSVTPLVTG
jgi:uncharacterized protein